MKLYAVSATIVHHTTDRCCLSADISKQVPSFLLNGDALGIVDEQHAEEIARAIIMPVELQYESVTIHVCAVRLS